MSRNNKGHDYSTLLIWAAALVTVVRYSAAFIASDLGQITGRLSDVITVAMGLSGLGMGILDVLGGTYLFDGLRRAMPSNGKAWTMRFKVLTALVIALMGSGVMILIPFTMSRVMRVNMDDVLGTGIWLGGWALLVNLTPYLLIGGVAIGNQVVSVSSQNLPETYRKLSEDERKLTGNFPTNWRQVRKKLTDEQVASLAQMETGMIVYTYEVDQRTARNWRRYAQQEVEKLPAEEPRP